MLMRTDPFRQWDRLFEQPAMPAGGAMDAYRVGDVITVEFDLPGVDADSVDVEIERGELRLSARRRISSPEEAQYLVRERSEQSISRRLMLGDVLDVDHVDAEYRDGVLTLRIPLHEKAKPRRVEVRHGSAEDASRAISVESSTS